MFLGDKWEILLFPFHKLRNCKVKEIFQGYVGHNSQNQNIVIIILTSTPVTHYLCYDKKATDGKFIISLQLHSSRTRWELKFTWNLKVKGNYHREKKPCFSSYILMYILSDFYSCIIMSFKENMLQKSIKTKKPNSEKQSLRLT